MRSEKRAKSEMGEDIDRGRGMVEVMEIIVIQEEAEEELLM